MNPASNLFFVGPMGAGKSTLGKRVAEALGLPFFDLDHEIQAQCGADIPLIFDIEGECGFRRRESAMLADFAKDEMPWVTALCESVADNAALLATGRDSTFQNKVHLAMQAKGFFDKGDDGSNG